MNCVHNGFSLSRIKAGHHRFSEITAGVFVTPLFFSFSFFITVPPSSTVKHVFCVRFYDCISKRPCLKSAMPLRGFNLWLFVMYSIFT